MPVAVSLAILDGSRMCLEAEVLLLICVKLCFNCSIVDRSVFVPTLSRLVEVVY